jgi:hypothetical protein
MTTVWTKQELEEAAKDIYDRSHEWVSGDSEQICIANICTRLSLQRNAMRDLLEKFIKAEEDGKYSFERFSPLTNEAREVLAKCK